MTDTRHALAALVDVCDVNKHVPYRVYHEALENARTALASAPSTPPPAVVEAVPLTEPVRGKRYESGDWSMRNWEAMCEDQRGIAPKAAQPVALPAGSSGLTDEKCDDLLRKSGLWPLACVSPQNRALLRGLCHESAVAAQPVAGAAPAPEPSAQGEPVAWEWAWSQKDWDEGRRTVGRGYPDKSHIDPSHKKVVRHALVYASAPSTPPHAVVEAVPLVEFVKTIANWKCSAEDGDTVSIWKEEACDVLKSSAPAPKLHPATADLVRRFSQALAEKLAAAEAKYGYSDGWASPDWMDECRAKLMEHIAKGDPRDVAAYCAFLWHHRASTAPVVEPVPRTDEIEELREAYALLFKSEGKLRVQNDTLRRLLAEAGSMTRHPDYDWPLCLQREVDEAAHAVVEAVPLTESLLRELLEDTREVFDANGSETPQSTRDVIEYMHSWLQVYADKSRGIAPKAAQPN